MENFSRSQNSKFTRIIKLKLTLFLRVFLATVGILARSARSRLNHSPLVKDEREGNFGRHRGMKSLVQTAVNLSKLGPAPKSFSAKSFRYATLDPIPIPLCICVQAPVLWSQTPVRRYVTRVNCLNGINGRFQTLAREAAVADLHLGPPGLVDIWKSSLVYD